jgi:hypothetical protein
MFKNIQRAFAWYFYSHSTLQPRRRQRSRMVQEEAAGEQELAF